MNEEFIAKLLAELFGFLCNFSPCEEHCNKCDEADCCMHYFEIKYKEVNENERRNDD